MAERAKITEFWICVSDDGTGPGEGMLTRVRPIGQAPDQRKGFPLQADCVQVPLMTFEQASVQKMVNKALETGKPFRVLHFSAAQDVTEQYAPARAR